MPSSATTPNKGLPQYLPDDVETREDVNRAYRIMDSIGAITQIGSPAYESKAELEAAFPDGDTKAYVADGIIYVWTGEWTSTGLDMSGYYTKPEVDGAFVALTDFEQAATFAQLTPGESTIVSLGKLMKWFANPEGFTPAFTQAGSLAQLVSGESLGTSLGKVMKVIADKQLAGTPADMRAALSVPEIEEINWLPTITGADVAGSPAYASRTGGGVRIGNLVFLYGNISVTTLGGASGLIGIGGLPVELAGTFHAIVPVTNVTGRTYSGYYESGKLTNFMRNDGGYLTTTTSGDSFTIYNFSVLGTND